MEHVGDVAGGPGSHGVGAAIFDRFFLYFFFFSQRTLRVNFECEPIVQKKVKRHSSYTKHLWDRSFSALHHKLEDRKMG